MDLAHTGMPQPDLFGMGVGMMGGYPPMLPHPPPPILPSFGVDADMQEMLMTHYMMQGGKPKPKKVRKQPAEEAEGAEELRRVASTLAAQLYGVSKLMKDGAEKVRVRRALRDILLKDSNIHPYMIEPAEPPPPFPRVSQEAYQNFYKEPLEEEEVVPEAEPIPTLSPDPSSQASAIHPYLLLELPQISGRYPWKEVEKPPPPPGVVPSDHVMERLDQRWKQVVIGLLTKGHRNFIQAHLKGEQLASIPSPPDIYTECSKREFDRQLRNWRRALHLFDTQNEDTDSKKSDSSSAPSLLDCENDSDPMAAHPLAWSAPPQQDYAQDADYPKEVSPKGGYDMKYLAATMYDNMNGDKSLKVST